MRRLLALAAVVLTLHACRTAPQPVSDDDARLGTEAPASLEVVDAGASPAGPSPAAIQPRDAGFATDDDEEEERPATLPSRAVDAGSTPSGPPPADAGSTPISKDAGTNAEALPTPDAGSAGRMAAAATVDAGPPPEAEPPPAPPKPKPELADALPLPPVPKGLPPLPPSQANPLTAEKADLGHKLFFDKRLSKDGSQACATCHHTDKAYTSGRAVDPKVGGAQNKRNAPSMLNLGFHREFYWDGRMPSLEAVSLAAWKGQLGADPAAIAKMLGDVPLYRKLFQRAFGEGPTEQNVPKALASFFRALTSGNSPWDKFIAGDAKALSAQAQAGWRLFGKLGCAQCHTPPHFTDFGYHNVGVGDDPGRKDATKDELDTGKFKTPSLRNVALTAPYFHDGSVTNLTEAIKLMAQGGVPNPHLDGLLKKQTVVSKDLSALKAFLEALNGDVSYPDAPELP